MLGPRHVTWLNMKPTSCELGYPAISPFRDLYFIHFDRLQV